MNNRWFWTIFSPWPPCAAMENVYKHGSHVPAGG